MDTKAIADDLDRISAAVRRIRSQIGSEDCMAVSDVAQTLGVSTITVRRLDKAGALTSEKIGKRRRWKRVDIERYREQQQSKTSFESSVNSQAKDEFEEI